MVLTITSKFSKDSILEKQQEGTWNNERKTANLYSSIKIIIYTYILIIYIYIYILIIYIYILIIYIYTYVYIYIYILIALISYNQ